MGLWTGCCFPSFLRNKRAFVPYCTYYIVSKLSCCLIAIAFETESVTTNIGSYLVIYVLYSHGRDRAESIEWFIEDQAFSPSYDLAPPPPPPPLPLVSSTGDTPETEKEGGADCVAIKSYDSKKAWPSISPFNTLWDKRVFPPPFPITSFTTYSIS